MSKVIKSFVGCKPSKANEELKKLNVILDKEFL